MTKTPFNDIPGTTLFDSRQSRMGFHLNQFCMSLMKAPNREAFKADERAYLDGWTMTEAQKRSVLDRDWNGMLALGGNIYFTAKIAATMSGVSEPEYAQMMLDGGRSIEGNRSKTEAR